MKKIITHSLSLLLAGFILFTGKTAHGQVIESDVVSVMRDGGWTKLDTRYVYLSEGQSSATWSRYFSDYLEYAVVAYSDEEDVLDIDIEILYPSGYPYLNDTEVGSLPVLTFSPPYSGNYGIRIKNYSSLSYLASYCKFTVFYRTRSN